MDHFRYHGIIFVIMLSNQTVCEAQYYNCFLSGDSTGHSSWCGDNVKEEEEIMKDPQAVMEGAIKFLDRHNKMVWDPMTWTIPPTAPPAPPSLPLLPALPSGALSILLPSAPAAPLPVVTASPAISAPVIPASDPLPPGQPARSELLPAAPLPSLPSSTSISLGSADLFPTPSPLSLDVLLTAPSLLPLDALLTTPPPLPLDRLLTSPTPFLLTLPTVDFGGAADHTLLPLPTLEPLPTLLPSDNTDAKNPSKNMPELQGDPIAPDQGRSPLYPQNLESLAASIQVAHPERVQGATFQQQVGFQNQVAPSEYRQQEMSRLLEEPPPPTPPESMFEQQSPVYDATDGLAGSRDAYDTSLLSIPHPKQSFDSPIDPVRRPLKPTRLTVNRSPAAFASREEPIDGDEHQVNRSNKLQTRPTIILMNPHIRPMKHASSHRNIL